MPELDPQERHLEYQPAPAVSADFYKQLKVIVPKCPNNIDLYLRFSWGMDVTEVLNGQIVRRYPDPEGKYVGLPFWVMEGWQAPDVYDEEQWRQNEELLGPYPANGVWDYIAIVQDDEGRFLNLGARALQMAREWRHWKSKSNKRALEDLLQRRCVSQVLKEKRFAAHKEQMLDEFVRDASRVERGGFDPRKRTLIGKITGGGYQQTENGLLVPSTI